MPHKIDRRISRARSLRANPTRAEHKLWQQLRHMPDAHFCRQATVGPYFADFACHKSKLVVELDGGQHADHARDANRTAYLEVQGYRVLRFWNNDVLGNTDGVMQIIVGALEVPPTPDPSPPQEQGEGSKSLSASDPASPTLHGEEGDVNLPPHVVAFRTDPGDLSPPPILHGGQGSGVGSSSNIANDNKFLSGGSA